MSDHSASARVASTKLHRLLQQGLELLRNSVTHLGSLGRTTNIGSVDTLLNHVPHGLVDLLGQLGLLERVLAHHAQRQDHGDGVDDTLAADVWCRA